MGEDVCWRGSDQGGAEPPAPQAPPRARGARAEVAVQRALPEARPGERCHQERGEEEGPEGEREARSAGPATGKACQRRGLRAGGAAVHGELLLGAAIYPCNFSKTIIFRNLSIVRR